MIELVTDLLGAELSKHSDIEGALGLIRSCTLFGRNTRSAALGEITEHLIARLLNGQRKSNGNRGADVMTADGRSIEVKSRLLGPYGDGVKFDFSTHTAEADCVYIVAWDNNKTGDFITEAYTLPVNILTAHWGGAQLKRHCARTTLGKVRLAYKIGRPDLIA